MKKTYKGIMVSRCYIGFLLIVMMTINTTKSWAGEGLPDSSYFGLKVEKGYQLVLKNQVREGINLLQEVIDSAELVDNKKTLAKAYSVKGTAFARLGKPKESHESLNQALAIYEELGNDRNGIISVCSNIGMMYTRFNNLDSAKVYFKKALAIPVPQANYLKFLTVAWTNFQIAKIYIKENNAEQSFSHLNQALLYAKNNLDEQARFKKRMRGMCYLYLAIAHTQVGNLKEAEHLYTKVDSFFVNPKTMGMLAQQTYLKERSKWYELNGDFENAYLTLEPYVAVSDSLFVRDKHLAREKEGTEFLLAERKKRFQQIREQQERSRFFDRLILLLSFLVGIGIIASIIFILKLRSRNKVLKESREELEKLESAKSEFYSEMSHELRTPLYAVTELSSLLLKENVNPKHAEYLNSLNFSGNHLLNLINNILKQNEIEYGGVTIAQVDFHLKNLLQDIIHSFDVAITNNKNTVSFDYDTAIQSELIGDKLKLTQVFLNLFSNANKFTKEGTINVGVSLLSETANSVHLQFSFEDTGVGINLDQQELIFQEFYQGEEIDAASYKGTGLGLSIVKNTLEAMGSEIQLESERGKGSRFWFDLELSKQKEQGGMSNDFDTQLKYLSNRRFLIVDDNKINQLVTGKILEKHGLTYKAVSSGEEAIEIAKSEPIDCILMDLNLLGMDGYEATQTIRTFNQDIAIVALTAGTVEEFKDKIMAVGMQGYVVKPFMIADFIRSVYQAIKTKE